jgi:L-alanine-DL-glutamate epimerase-like enolase superfamily enzyme
MRPGSHVIESVESFVVKIGDREAGHPYYGETDYYPTDICVYSSKFEQTLVKITTESGLEGWGEVQAPVAPEVATTLIETLLGPMLLGENPVAVERLWDRMYESMNVRGHYQGFMIDAMAGLDIALWDLKGTILDAPVSSLLGSRRRDELTAYVTGPGGDAHEYLEAGFDAVKVGHVTDIADLDSVRDALSDHPAASLLVDHHWSMDTVHDAIRLGRQLEELGVGFVEAPLPPEDIDGAARVTDAVDVPVALGESLRTTHDFKLRLQRDVFDIAQPDINRTGLTEGMRIAELVDTYGRPVAPHIGGSLSIAMVATWHLASAISNFLIQEHQPDRFAASDEYLSSGIDLHDGHLPVPDGPGLGIDIEESALEPYITDRRTVRA